MDDTREDPVLPRQAGAEANHVERAARAIASAGPDRGLTTMFWALGVAASFMLAAAFGALWYATRADLAATRENVGRLDAMVKERDRQAAFVSQEVAWLRDASVQVALLRGLEGNPDARAKLLWNPGTKQGILWVSGLPPLPLEKCYELWAFVGDEPMPAGTFDAKSGAAAVVPISRQEPLNEAPVKFAVSVEPKGGGPKPTGAIVLAGERF
ncbi:MAG: anti-sigma factor [Thermoanaerobaculia bacterium]